MNNFSFSGESHNFWEFVCVDKGEVGVSHGENYTILKKNDLIFHKPNEFHDVKATWGIAPNLVLTVTIMLCISLMTVFYKLMKQNVIYLQI